MNPTIALATFASGVLCTVLVSAHVAEPQDPAPDMREMMEKARRWTQPGEAHEALERFVGKWTLETRISMGAQSMPPETGTAEFRWRMPGRWLEGTWSGSMMGMQHQGLVLLGYDNFKMSYVSTQVTSGDTAMTHAEGDMTPDGKSLLMYGTLDEYLTGEHDKMVKYAWRFVSADELRLEVHDLPIGETNTKVVEFTYKRAK